MQSLWIIDSQVFKHPFSCLVAGPSQSGKTNLMFQILKHNREIISPIPDRIVYCYSAWQEFFNQFSEITPVIEFHKGIKTSEEFDPSINNLIVLDDLMEECESNIDMQNLFTKDSHHKNISVFFLSQNLFSRGKYARTMSLNCQYIIAFNNPRDKFQLSVLGRQMFVENTKFFQEALKDICENKEHPYIFLDLRVSTSDKNRVQTGIIPGERRFIYTPK